MTAAVRDLVIEQGSTFTLGFNWHREGELVDGLPTPGDPYDLTGCTARMQVRRKQGDPVLLTATSIDVPTEEPARTEAIEAGAGRIKLGGVTGRIDITLTDEDTDLLTAKSAAYDLEIEWPPDVDQLRPHVDRLLQGIVTVIPNITQNPPDDPLVT